MQLDDSWNNQQTEPLTLSHMASARSVVSAEDMHSAASSDWKDRPSPGAAHAAYPGECFDWPAPYSDEELKDIYANAGIVISLSGQLVLRKLSNSRAQRLKCSSRPNFGFGSRTPPVNFTEPPIPSLVAQTKTAGQRLERFAPSKRALMRKLSAADYWLRVLRDHSHDPLPDGSVERDDSGGAQAETFEVPHGQCGCRVTSDLKSAAAAPLSSCQETAAGTGNNVQPESVCSRQENSPYEQGGRSSVGDTHLTPEEQQLLTSARDVCESPSTAVADPLWAIYASAGVERRPSIDEAASCETDAARNLAAFENWWAGYGNNGAFEAFAIGEAALDPDFFSAMDG